MPQENKVSATFTAADKQAILKQLAAIRQLLKPVLNHSLSPEDRKNMAKMGDKSLAFVGKALDYAGKNSSLVPPYLDLAEANKDYALAADLKEFSHELATLSQAVEDNLMMAGAEAYDAALIFHASVKGASRTNTPGSEAIYDDLVQRFPRGSRKSGQSPAAKTNA